MNDPALLAIDRQPQAQVQPFPVSQWQVSEVPGPSGHIAPVAITPFGPHVYVLDRDDAKKVGQALTAPRILQPPTI